MTAFDSDVLSDLFKNAPAVVTRIAAIPVADQFVPVVVAEELLRGQLDSVRRAQSGRGPIPLEVAYAYFTETLVSLRGAQLLPYTAAAHSLFLAWRTAKVRVGTNDLRIAAICIAHGAKLVTRNARDYGQVPGLNLEIWT